MKRLYRGVEWKTLLLILLCYGGWVFCGWLWSTHWWWAGLMALPFVTAFHSSLQHETIHGHPTSNNLINELLVSLPLGMVFPYRRYKDLHLKHHNDAHLTDPYEDPESYFWPLESYLTMRPLMRRLFLINNTFVGRLLIGPALTIIGFGRTEVMRLREGEPGVRLAWVFHGLGLAALLTILSQVFAMPLWVYFFCGAYPAMSLISMRAYAEHQAAENVGGRTAVVETCPAFALLYLNNNLHIAHHAHPAVPWYDLPDLYAERKEQYLAANGNTLFNGYGEIALRFAFTIKQPVDHPFLHRSKAGAK